MIAELNFKLIAKHTLTLSPLPVSEEEQRWRKGWPNSHRRSIDRATFVQLDLICKPQSNWCVVHGQGQAADKRLDWCSKCQSLSSMGECNPAPVLGLK